MRRRNWRRNLMATIKPNSYVLNVDIKQRMSNKTPRFVQFDEAQIVFKIYDGGKPFDLSGFTSAVVTHKTRSNQVISGYGTFEELNGRSEERRVGKECRSGW